MTMTHPWQEELGPDLYRLANPAQYLGGEYGSTDKEADFHTGVVFPDAYTIGMSNHTIKLLYRLINGLEGIRAERYFCPEKDMEALLRQRGLGLRGLETGRLLKDLDLVCISVGYELLATNVLTILDLGGLSRRSEDRGPGEPLVLGGGPAMTNPLPLGPFFDAVVIGEAEGVLPEILAQARAMRQAGVLRAEILAWVRSLPPVWYPGKTTRARRAVWKGFATDMPQGSVPVPSIKVAQDHGFVEIMRGCPQGCRFCHAGIYYRPYRQRSALDVARSVDHAVRTLGYRQVTLASLSSGDYPGIKDLFRKLNQHYQDAGVGFNLPSLKVNSFNLDLVDELSSGKKSGLTFAVETPRADNQARINKLVPREDVVRIITEAKAKGWRSAKLYFMIGLPVDEDPSLDDILDFIRVVRQETKISLNISIGTFVPKPHTAFQWARQIDPRAAYERLSGLKARIRDPGVKVSYQHTFQSFLEGLIARGDHRAADLIEAAWLEGARFDAWEEGLDKALWEGVFARAGWDVAAFVGREPPLDEPLPWDSVDLGAGSGWLKRECARAAEGTLTPFCSDDCHHRCAACGPSQTVEPAEHGDFQDLDHWLASHHDTGHLPARLGDQAVDAPALLFSFCKEGSAAFIPHLGLIQTLERAFLRAGLPYALTNGYSPGPILELAQALSLGVEGSAEMGLVYLHRDPGGRDWKEALNAGLPRGLRIMDFRLVQGVKGGRNAPSLGKLVARARYALTLGGPELPHDFVTAFLGGTDLPGMAPGSSGPWEVELPSSGDRSLRKRAEAALGPDYLARGLSVRRLALGTEADWGIDSFARPMDPWRPGNP